MSVLVDRERQSFHLLSEQPAAPRCLWTRKKEIISFESSEERIGFLLLVVFMACVVGFAVWHAYAYPPCAGLHGKELRDCEYYQVYLSEFSDEHDEHTNDD
jgi:hypothetical protein